MEIFFGFFFGIIAGLAVSVPIGPVGLIIFERSVLYGLRTGILSGFMVALVDLLFVLTFLFGVHNGLNHQTLPLWVYFLGAIIVFYYGIHVFFHEPAKQQHLKTKDSGHIWKMLIIILGNPSTYLSFGIISFLLSSHLLSTLTVKIFVIIGFFIGSFFWWYFLAWFAYQKRDFYLKSTKLHQILGLAIVALAIVTLLKPLL